MYNDVHLSLSYHISIFTTLKILCAPLLFIVSIVCFVLFCFGCVGSLFCAQAFSGCGEQGLLFIAVRGLLIAVVSLVVEHGLQ